MVLLLFVAVRGWLRLCLGHGRIKKVWDPRWSSLLTLFGAMYRIDFLFTSDDTTRSALRSVEEHRVHVRQVVQRLLENRLYVKAEKCVFHVASVSFLGYIIGQGQISMDPSKVSAVAE